FTPSFSLSSFSRSLLLPRVILCSFFFSYLRSSALFTLSLHDALPIFEREFMQERVGQFCLSLSKSIDAYTGALTSLLKNNNGTHELENIDIVNFRSLSLGQHKAYVHYLPSHYGFSGVIQVVYRRGAVTGGFRNKLLAVREITDINLSGKKIISLKI